MDFKTQHSVSLPLIWAAQLKPENDSLCAPHLSLLYLC
jgi:hypothetical protein